MPEATAAELNRITETIIAGAIKIHRTFGSGLLESACGACLCNDLVKAGLRVERQKRLPLVYDGLKLRLPR